MRNLCVILADQLNQELSSLNDFDKDIDFSKIKTIIFDTTGSDFIQSTERL